MESIKRRGLAVPGDLAQEFGWPRSSLAYNLGRLIKQGKIVRVGGGRSIRFRVTTPEEAQAAREALWANKKQRAPYGSKKLPPPPETPMNAGPIEKLQEEGLVPGGLRSLFKKLLKG